MREIVLDIETTGLWINAGHRVIEVACIELERHQPTGRIFHRYVNPLMARMPVEAFEIHGISIEFLWRHAPFKNVADSLLQFIGSDQLIIHNAAFDIAFINMELASVNRPSLANPHVDTLSIARNMYRGASNSLDALCRRFGIDLTGRSQHGALIDCALLATVYLELIGGRQPLFALPAIEVPIITVPIAARPVRPPRPHPPLTPAELVNFEITLQQIDNPMWLSGQATGRPVILDDDVPF